MMRVLIVTLIGLIALCLTGAGRTGIPDQDYSHVELPDGLGMTTCPKGDGPPLEPISVFAVSVNDEACVGVPSDLFSFAVDGEVTIVPIDEETDDDGRVRFRMVGDETIVRLEPDWMHIRCEFIDIHLSDVDSLLVNSYDLDESGVVDDKDVAIFQSLYLAEEDPRADFNWDGIVDMKDLSLMTDHSGHRVPEKEEKELDPTLQPAPDKTIKAEPPVWRKPVSGDEGD